LGSEHYVLGRNTCEGTLVAYLNTKNPAKMAKKQYLSTFTGDNYIEIISSYIIGFS
jgi:hypothetical protein